MQGKTQGRFPGTRRRYDLTTSMQDLEQGQKGNVAFSEEEREHKRDKIKLGVAVGLVACLVLVLMLF